MSNKLKNKIAIPLSVPYFNGNEWRYLKKCLDSGWVSSSGGFVNDFEQAIARYTSAGYAVACVNGTCGLQVALRLSGVGFNDEVIVPALTFIAPVNAVKYLYAEPVFMDCDDYLNLDPEKLSDFCKQECKKTGKGLINKKSKRVVKAVLPVHVFGNPCNMQEVVSIARKYGLRIIEDATESLGSYFTQGRFKNRYTGTLGDIGVLSFNGNKIITCGGGGMILTNNKTTARTAKYLTNQAKDDGIEYVHKDIGYNFRLTNLQAALGLAQLEQLEGFIERKEKKYAYYKELLRITDGYKLLDPPEGTRPNYWFYSLIIKNALRSEDKRRTIMKKLAGAGIETRPIWYLNHLQKPYRKNQAYRIEKAVGFRRSILNIPCSVNLTYSQIEKVVAALKNSEVKNG